MRAAYSGSRGMAVRKEEFEDVLHIFFGQIPETFNVFIRNYILITAQEYKFSCTTEKNVVKYSIESFEER